MEKANTNIQRARTAPAGATRKDEDAIRREHEGRLWQLLVSEGSVMVNRANELRSVGKGLAALSVVAIAGSIALFLGSSLTAGEAVKGWKVNQETINSWAAGATLKNPSPAFTAATSSSEDYARFVSTVIATPSTLVAQASGPAAAGAIPCAPMESLSETWANPATGVPDRPRCKFAGDSVFVASFVQDSSTGRPLIYPALGVFHKEGGRWDYYNFDGGMAGGIFALRDRKSVSIYQIANAVNSAFPGALSKGDVTAPRTAWGMAKKLFGKN